MWMSLDDQELYVVERMVDTKTRGCSEFQYIVITQRCVVPPHGEVYNAPPTAFPHCIISHTYTKVHAIFALEVVNADPSGSYDMLWLVGTPHRSDPSFMIMGEGVGCPSWYYNQ